MMHQYTYELINTQKINSDIIELSLRPQNPKHYIDYQAGQYVISKVNNIAFPLSIANAPNKTHELVFHLRHNLAQPQSQDFLNQVQQSNALQLEGPHGRMIANNISDDNQLVLLAGGTGIAPFKALLDDLVRNASPLLNKISLFWGVRKTEDLYLEAWLKQAKNSYPGFSYHIILSDIKANPDWTGATGWVYEHALKVLKNLDKPTRVFASGPYEMVVDSQAAFLAAGLEAEHFISDMLS